MKVLVGVRVLHSLPLHNITEDWTRVDLLLSEHSAKDKYPTELWILSAYHGQNMLVLGCCTDYNRRYENTFSIIFHLSNLNLSN